MIPIFLFYCFFDNNHKKEIKSYRFFCDYLLRWICICIIDHSGRIIFVYFVVIIQNGEIKLLEKL